MLTRMGTWVGKPAYLATDPLTIQEGQQEIAWAITKCWIKVRGPGHPHVNLVNLHNHADLTNREILPERTTPRDANLDHQLSASPASKGLESQLA